MRLPENLLTVEDFLENDAFRTWVMERRPEDQLYWQEWLAQNPHKRDIYEQAVATFLVIQGKNVDLSNQQVLNRTEKIIETISATPTVIKTLLYWGRWVAAAAIVGLVLYWQFDKPITSQFALSNKKTEQSIGDESWKVVKNATGQPAVVLLPDNSSVLLTTGSQLRFRKRANHRVREVFLQGEGFFEVTKNPAKPFIVYTTNLTTKVLGTSFQVRSFENEATAFVKVKTGKVTVTPASSPGKSVLLTVNQELKLEAGSEHTVKHKNFLLDGNASAIITEPFAFNYTPIPEVLDELAQSYHMPIQYDRGLLANCTFTGQLNDQPYLEKIRLICLTIESTFEVIDNQVVIHSRGCK
jgi:transmembrane sensor